VRLAAHPTGFGEDAGAFEATGGPIRGGFVIAPWDDRDTESQDEENHKTAEHSYPLTQWL
jgi:hypothetical protein